ncbi:hypothetical protein AYI69_g1672 [Smittium culicis]|uniref:Uncharacterized protein n=1 Tax=Smittium culicis TaxID=133412 RepID=A0A1R1YPR8_9FUNG|nr:hypothetical protein AYI69_g1672 [Smittium culicis]
MVIKPKSSEDQFTNPPVENMDLAIQLPSMKLDSPGHTKSKAQVIDSDDYNTQLAVCDLETRYRHPGYTTTSSLPRVSRSFRPEKLQIFILQEQILEFNGLENK